MRRLLTTVAACLGLLALPAWAAAGTITLHPSGFGEHSYSAWKAGEGEPDSTGAKNQALYFQKMTSTVTNAAGVAVFKGVEGLPTSAVWPLAFDYRLDGHCGAGAPRFNLRVETMFGMRQTFFFGCNSGMVPGPASEPNWERRTTIGPLPPPGTVVSLSIVFDEGNDIGQGFVYLDDIQVGDHVWTSASDNGNGATITADPLGEDYVSALLGEPVLDALTQ